MGGAVQGTSLRSAGSFAPCPSLRPFTMTGDTTPENSEVMEIFRKSAVSTSPVRPPQSIRQRYLPLAT